MSTSFEDNNTPYLLFVETASASVPTPAADKQEIFLDTDHSLKRKNSSGTVTDIEGVLAFKTIAVSGQSDVVADSSTDTLTLVAGTNVTLTTNASTDTVTITAAGGGGSGTVTHTGGALTSGKVLEGAGSDDIAVSSLTATVVKASSGTLSAASAGTDYVAPGGALGTPSSGTLTSCTGLPTAGLVNNAVTNAKAAQMAAHTFKGNNTGSTADPIDMTVTQATAELNAMVGDSGSGGTKGLVPAPASGDAAAAKFLKADGTWSAPSGSGAPSSAQYVTLALDGGLSAERVLTAGTGISLTDGGANGNVTIAATGAGSGLVLLEQHTASSSSSLDFTSCISSTYDAYMIQIVSLVPASNAQGLKLLVSTNGGSSYDTGSNYNWQALAWHGTGAVSGSGGDGSGALISVDGGFGSNGISNTSTNPLSGFIYLYDPLSTSVYKYFEGRIRFKESNGGVPFNNAMSGTYISTTAVNAFQFIMTSGNIASGTIRCYGIAK